MKMLIELMKNKGKNKRDPKFLKVEKQWTSMIGACHEPYPPQ